MGETTISATVQTGGMAAFAGARVYVENFTYNTRLRRRQRLPPLAQSRPASILASPILGRRTARFFGRDEAPRCR
jgi:hypothetical protein